MIGGDEDDVHDTLLDRIEQLEKGMQKIIDRQDEPSCLYAEEAMRYSEYDRAADRVIER